MYSKFYFDSHNFSLTSFRDKLISFDFRGGTTYYFHLFSDSGKRLGSVIPFYLSNYDEKDKLIEELFFNILNKISCLELYSDSKSFCVLVSSDLLAGFSKSHLNK
jgi:hypothetical protein